MFCAQCGKPSDTQSQYCSNCGRELKNINVVIKVDLEAPAYCGGCGEENRVGNFYYCIKCGQGLERLAMDKKNSPMRVAEEKIAPVVQNTIAFNKDLFQGLKIYIALVTSVISIVLIFQKWITVPAIGKLSNLFGYSLESEYTLFQVLDFLNTFTDHVGRIKGTGDLMVIVILLLAVTVITLLSHGIFCYKLLANYQRSFITGKFAMAMSFILPIVVWAMVFFINSHVSQESDGYIRQILGTTNHPLWLLLIGGIGQYVAIKIAEKERIDVTSNNENY